MSRGRLRAADRASVMCSLVVITGLALLAPAAAAFDLQGHRGARGLAPENTLAAFRVALGIGVTTLETDLALTSDRVLVLSHESRLSAALTRGPDGRWLDVDGPPLVSLDSRELDRYDIGRLNPVSRYAAQWPDQRAVDGERIPTLVSLLELARDARSPSGRPVRFNLETKITPTGEVPTASVVEFTAAVVDAVQRAGLADRVTIQSFDWRTLIEVRRRVPGIATACLTIDSSGMNTVQVDASGASPWHAGLKAADYGGSIVRLAHAAGCSVWSPFWRNVSAASVAEAQALGLRVLPWTVNDPAEIARLARMGVDGLITDYPDRARRILDEIGIAVD